MLKQLGKGAAATGVAAVLAASISLGQAAPAEAFLPALLAPVLIGGTGMTLAGVLGTTSLISGIGWGIAGAGVLGVGAYSTRDWWVPIVTGTYGQDEEPPTDPVTDKPINYTGTTGTEGQTHPAEPKPGSSMQKFKPGTIMGSPPLDFNQTLNGVNMRVSYSGADGAFVMSLDVSLYCKRPDNSTYKTSYEWKPILSGNGGGYPTSTTGKTYCQQSTHSLLGAVAGNFGGDPRLRPKVNDTGFGVENIVEFGTTEPWTASTPPETAFDTASPELKYRSTVECVRPDGSLFEISAESTGADAAGQAVKMPSCDAASPGSHSTMKQQVESLAPGETTWEKRWGMESPAPEADKPLCDVRRPGQGCQLAVKLDGKLCTIGSWECANWTDLAKDPTWTERLSCQYGPYAVPLNTCNPLERAYEEGGAPATEKNMDGDPSTRSDTMPNGQPQPKENTGTGGSTGTAPATGPGTSTVPGGAATPSPGGSSEGCFPGGWAVFNPMWIVDGISCSFIPKMDITTRVQTLQDLASTKAPLSWMNPVMTGPGGGGCPNWVVSVPGFSKNVVCESSFTAAIVGARGPLFGLVAGAMMWPLFRSLWYAAIPILRVTPASSK